MGLSYNVLLFQAPKEGPETLLMQMPYEEDHFLSYVDNQVSGLRELLEQ